LGGLETVPISIHGRPCSLTLTLPPLGVLFFRFDAELKPTLAFTRRTAENVLSSFQIGEECLASIYRYKRGRTDSGSAHSCRAWIQ
jgi:hypothetical protein